MLKNDQILSVTLDMAHYRHINFENTRFHDGHVRFFFLISFFTALTKKQKKEKKNEAQ